MTKIDLINKTITGVLGYESKNEFENVIHTYSNPLCDE